jgi:predicted ATPase
MIAFILPRHRLAEQLKRWRARYRTVEQLIGAAELHVQAKAYLLADIAPDRFEEIKAVFCDMFSSVEDIRVGPLSEREAEQFFFGFEDALIFSLKERGTDTWVPEMSMSSGMLRTLLHLFEVSLSPRGSVILIDEFENSLGLNCMPSLTDFILQHAPDHQFIITSHHPYIINQIPIDRWKLVRRRGSRVRVVPAPEVPALQGASHLDAFTRLLSLPEEDWDAVSRIPRSWPRPTGISIGPHSTSHTSERCSRSTV